METDKKNTSLGLYLSTRRTISFLNYHNVVICGSEKNHWQELYNKLKKLRNELDPLNNFLFIPYIWLSLMLVYVQLRRLS